MAIRPLEGFVVGVTADRRREELTELLARRGAAVTHGRTLGYEDCTEDRLRHQTEELIARPPDVLVVTTSTGMRIWFEAADRWGLRSALTAALSTSFIAVRGAKAVEATNSAELTPWWLPPSERSGDLVAHLLEQAVAGRRIAVQLDGRGSPTLCAALADSGAELVELTTYRWARPDDDQPAAALVEAACEGRLDAVTFTAAPAIHNLFAIARDHHLEAELREALETRVACACIGDSCAEAAREHGVQRSLVPPRRRVGSLVQALGEHLSARRRTLVLCGRHVTVQGSLAIVEGDPVTMTGRERGVFEALADRPGAVVSKARLARDIWGSSASTRAVDTTVSRLRRRLGPAGGAIRTTRNRGYWLALVSGL